MTNYHHLYCFFPKGHGQLSFFVMSSSEKQAMKYVDRWILERKKAQSLMIDYQCKGWRTDYYNLEIAGVGEVFINDND